MKKTKIIEICKSFLRPAGSWGQAQRFIPESDIVKMAGQICDLPEGVDKNKIIEILKKELPYVAYADKFGEIADRLCEDQWVSVEDQLPEAGVNVWICYKGKHGNKQIAVGSLFEFKENDPYNYFYTAVGRSDILVRYVHCWMPYFIPSAPKKLKR